MVELALLPLRHHLVDVSIMGQMNTKLANDVSLIIQKMDGISAKTNLDPLEFRDLMDALTWPITSVTVMSVLRGIQLAPVRMATLLTVSEPFHQTIERTNVFGNPLTKLT